MDKMGAYLLGFCLGLVIGIYFTGRWWISELDEIVKTYREGGEEALKEYLNNM